jgi:hypothetical protein
MLDGQSAILFGRVAWIFHLHKPIVMFSCYPSPVVQASIAKSYSCTSKVHIAVAT